MRSDFTILPKLNDNERVIAKTLNGGIKPLNSMVDRRASEASAVGLSAILLSYINDRLCRLFVQKFGRRISIGLTNGNATDKIRNGRSLCIFLYNMDYNVMCA